MTAGPRGGTKLVIGASGFLGSRVTHALVAAGEHVRVMLRSTSSTRGLDGLRVDRVYGDIFDDDAVRAAMIGCDDVYYCVVDARMWLRDPAPLFRTNVEGLRRVLDAAVAADLLKFVFTSTTGTLAISSNRLVTEDDVHDWSQGGPYIESRVAAEQLVLQYARDKGLPAVAMCISTTYGPQDWQPTPHGSVVAAVARGRMPVNFGFSSEVVGIDDAARAMLLGAERGRIGQRYIVSDRYMSNREINAIAAAAVGRKPPPITLPVPVLLALAEGNDIAARLLRRDLRFAVAGVRMADLMSALDHSKAERELGWRPQPVERSIEAAARFFHALAT